VVERGVRFWLGLLVGVPLGAGITWLAMARPWQGGPGEAAVLVIDAGVEQVTDKTRSKRPRRGPRRGEGAEDAPAPVLTAADRAPVSRGPTISLPDRQLDLTGGGAEGRPLQASEIDETIRGASGPVLACIADARAGAELRADVRLQLLVGGDGRVSKVRVTAPRWLVQHGLADCASAAARRWRFPATGAPTVVDAPFHLD
jgi:hypothetical protein